MGTNPGGCLTETENTYDGARHAEILIDMLIDEDDESSDESMCNDRK